MIYIKNILETHSTHINLLVFTATYANQPIYDKYRIRKMSVSIFNSRLQLDVCAYNVPYITEGQKAVSAQVGANNRERTCECRILKFEQYAIVVTLR